MAAALVAKSWHDFGIQSLRIFQNVTALGCIGRLIQVLFNQSSLLKYDTLLLYSSSTEGSSARAQWQLGIDKRQFPRV